MNGVSQTRPLVRDRCRIEVSVEIFLSSTYHPESPLSYLWLTPHPWYLRYYCTQTLTSGEETGQDLGELTTKGIVEDANRDLTDPSPTF